MKGDGLPGRPPMYGDKMQRIQFWLRVHQVKRMKALIEDGKIDNMSEAVRDGIDLYLDKYDVID